MGMKEEVFLFVELREGLKHFLMEKKKRTPIGMCVSLSSSIESLYIFFSTTFV